MVQRAERRSAAEWSQIVAEFKAGSETAQVFCDRLGLHPVTFGKWCRITLGLSKPRQAYRRPSAARFVAVTIPTPPAIRERLTVYAGDVRIECPMGLGVESIAQLVKALRHER
jgi:hypothetical protein